MKLICLISLIFSRTLLVNREDDVKFVNLETKHDDSIEKGKGRGQLDDLNIELNNEEEMKKFHLVSMIPDVPEGMGQVSKIIENFVTDEIVEMKKGERFFLIFFVDEKTALLPAEHVNNDMKIFISTDKKLAEEMNTPFPGVYGFNPRDKVSYQFQLNEETVKTISSIVSLDLIGVLSYENLEAYRATGLHSYYVFIKPEDIPSFFYNFKSTATKVKHLGKFCIIPYKGDREQLKVFGMTEEDLPGLLFINNGEKYPLKKCTENDIVKFVQDVLDKKLEPVYSSQDEPENNNELNVKVITRNNLENFKNDNTRDRLLIFSSPGCSYCNQLRPILEEIGSVIKTNADDKLAIGACDITINDINGFDISSVPKIYLIKGKTGEIILFEAKERTFNTLAEFINLNGEFKVDLKSFIKIEEEKVETPVSDIEEKKPAESIQSDRGL